MDIPYCQLDAKQALRLYADWLLEQRVEKPFPFFKALQQGSQKAEWYMIFYPLRALMLASDLLGDDKYRETAFDFVDIYLSEQLPNGAFTSNYRRQPTSKLTKRAFQEILRTGKVNLADNGSNVTGIVQAAMAATGERRERYLQAARRWFDEWVPIWALPDGSYGNGIWGGHKMNAAYTCGIGTTAAALAAFGAAVGESEYVENAERCIRFQCEHWLPDGLPVNFNCYPRPSQSRLNDYGHTFYLLEGMCWTHFASKELETRSIIGRRLTDWIFGEAGILSQWRDSWLNHQMTAHGPWGDEMSMSREGIRPGWELAKSNGIPHALLYYLRHVSGDARLQEKVELGLKYLTHPLKARMSGVCSDPDESYGDFAVQATGFAGLSLAEAVKPDAVFESVRRP